MADGARQTEPASDRLVGVFRPWRALAGVSGRRSSCPRSRSALPRSTAQGARARRPAVLLHESVRGPRRAASLPRANWTAAVSLTLKSVGKPDAGNPHVRLCVQRKLACSAGERPAGARVRSPVVWIAGWRETKTLKPIDNVSLGETTSRRAVMKVNANVASKMRSPEGRAHNRRAKAAWGVEI